jgi:hypothetical protein
MGLAGWNPRRDEVGETAAASRAVLLGWTTSPTYDIASLLGTNPEILTLRGDDLQLHR